MKEKDLKKKIRNLFFFFFLLQKGAAKAAPRPICGIPCLATREFAIKSLNKKKKKNQLISIDQITNATHKPPIEFPQAKTVIPIIASETSKIFPAADNKLTNSFAIA